MVWLEASLASKVTGTQERTTGEKMWSFFHLSKDFLDELKQARKSALALVPSGLKGLRVGQIKIRLGPNENQATSLGLIKYVLPPSTRPLFFILLGLIFNNNKKSGLW